MGNATTSINGESKINQIRPNVACVMIFAVQKKVMDFFFLDSEAVNKISYKDNLYIMDDINGSIGRKRTQRDYNYD